MFLPNPIIVGFKEIWAHKFRSALTMLGIVLGVSSLVGMSALVKGMENGMKEALIAVGGVEKIRIEPKEIPVRQQHLADQATGTTIQDVYALEHSAPLIKLVSPEMRASSGRLFVSRGMRTVEWCDVIGNWPSAIEMNQHVVEHGRMFNAIDEENGWNVCVIGTNIRDQLFGSEEELGREIIPLGETINISGQPFRIIGMFQTYESGQDRKKRELAQSQPKAATAAGPERSRGWGGKGRGGSIVYIWKNNNIYIPLRTMLTRFRSGVPGFTTVSPVPDPRLSALNIKVRDIELLEPALQQAKNVLMHTHKGIEDFSFQTQENQSEQITTSIKNLRMSGGIVSAISLFVGGIGIMNIMLASITERIREIGIRKAIGANGLDIFIQILIESLVIAVLGGMAGVAASYGLVDMLVVLSPTGNTPVITLSSILTAFAFSAAVGVLAGIFPAIKAARLNPIQALRYD